jgi:protein arginine N-methyltransferase 1
VLGAGTLQCIPNAKNPRDLDISISYEFDGKNGKASNTQSYRMR